MELLVVTSVIAVLIAILLPVLTHARALARNVQCLSSLRQISTMLNVYVTDSNDWLPPYTDGDIEPDEGIHTPMIRMTDVGLFQPVQTADANAALHRSVLRDGLRFCPEGGPQHDSGSSNVPRRGANSPTSQSGA